MKKKTISILLLFLFAITPQLYSQSKDFVATRQHEFVLGNKPYRFIGANYWYGGLQGLTEKGRERIKEELDFLEKKGVNNLRILAGAEGTGMINGVTRVAPALQPLPGVFQEAFLSGLDFLLAEMGKRHMKAIIFFSNNWEWSGGFLQYLNWNGLVSDSVLARKLMWDEMRDYVSRFYSCANCIHQYEAQVKLVIERTNGITQKKYKNDPVIMAWEIANEPRPMRPGAIERYEKFMSNMASLIKSLDQKHLVTTGSEGEMGSENIDVFKAIHEDRNIDYATIHIWPKNWGWFQDTSIAASMGFIISRTRDYIEKHAAVTGKLAKPLVVEEFGLPRDGQSFQLSATTSSRDAYYKAVFSELLEPSQPGAPTISGVNFWAFSGSGRPSYRQLLWKKGEDFLGDPPMEEQGLNSVFDTDTTTWNIIGSFTRKLKLQQ